MSENFNGASISFDPRNGAKTYSDYGLFDNDISTPPSACDTIGETYQSGRSVNMSFVGIVLCDDAVFGFGDSKGTVSVNNTFQEDTVRGPIRKVFLSKEFIITTYGTNSFSDRFGLPVPIEEWMEKNIRRYGTPEEMFAAFQDSICDNSSANMAQYGFISGGFDKDGPYAKICTVNNKIVTINPKIRHRNGEPLVITGGDGYYTNGIATGLLADSIKGCGIGDMMPAIRERVGEMISDADRLGYYNPAGGDVTVEMLMQGSK